jgi:hypothetical protein
MTVDEYLQSLDEPAIVIPLKVYNELLADAGREKRNAE